MRALRLRIWGRVQGVGYRAWLAGEAAAAGLSGWVRNRRDGSVEALVSGPAAAVDALVAAAGRGPRLARVDEVLAETAGPAGEGFEILPTA